MCVDMELFRGRGHHWWHSLGAVYLLKFLIKKFLSQSLLLAWNWPCLLGWLAGLPESFRSYLLTYLALVLQAQATTPRFLDFLWVLEVVLCSNL